MSMMRPSCHVKQSARPQEITDRTGRLHGKTNSVTGKNKNDIIFISMVTARKMHSLLPI